jgi:AraC-like DNA-binding protein
VQVGALHDLVDAVAWCVHGERPAEVAAVVGFHDQAHLTRHLRRLLGVTPAAYARSAQWLP